MSQRMGPGKARLDVAIDKDVVVICKRLHKAYNHRTGLSLSFAKFVEGMLTSYLHTQAGKELLQYVIKKGI